MQVCSKTKLGVKYEQPETPHNRIKIKNWFSILNDDSDQEEEEQDKITHIIKEQQLKVKDKSQCNVDKTREDVLEELITTCVNVDTVKRNEKKSELREELLEINVLETEVAGNIRFKMQEKIWDKLRNDYREMVIEHEEKQEEKMER